MGMKTGLGANVPAPNSVTMEAVVELFRFVRQFAADKGDMATALKALEEAYARNVEAYSLVGKAEEIPGMWEEAAAANTAASENAKIAERKLEQAASDAKGILDEAYEQRRGREAALLKRERAFAAKEEAAGEEMDRREKAVSLRERTVEEDAEALAEAVAKLEADRKQHADAVEAFEDYAARVGNVIGKRP